MATVAECLSARSSQEEQLFPVSVLVAAVERVTSDAIYSPLRIEWHVPRNSHGRGYIHGMGSPLRLSVIISVASDACRSDLIPKRRPAVIQRQPCVAIQASYISGHQMDVLRISGLYRGSEHHERE
jgi:hypothetical protein